VVEDGEAIVCGLFVEDRYCGGCYLKRRTGKGQVVIKVKVVA
jgi:hypothetical protein